MEWIRTYPPMVHPEDLGRAFIVDTIPHVYMDRNYVPVFQGLTASTAIVEWDIALSAEDRDRFIGHVEARPGRVHVAPYRLYPVSTGLSEPVWAHRTADLAWIPEGQPWCNLFGLGLAWIPLAITRAFLDTGPQLADDTAFSQWHHQAGLGPVPVHWDVRPVHLHY